MAHQKPARLAVAEDVAKKVGVSPSTVHRVFDPKWNGKVRDVTRERILEAAAKLGYTPNAIARSLNASRTNIVAVVVGDVVGYFYHEVYFRLLSRIQASGRQVLAFETNPKQGIENIVRQVHQYRVDAIIILANATSTYVEEYFQEFGTPVILFNRTASTAPVCSVRSDIVPAIRGGIHFLVDNGLTQMAYISGEGHTSDEQERTQCILESIRDCGATLVHQIDGDYSYEAGFYGAHEIMRLDRPVDVIVCAADNYALGVVDGVRSLGLCVPHDVSVLGFDNIIPTGLDAYQITTIGHLQAGLIDATMEVLDVVMEDAGVVAEKLVPMELVVRSSVKLKD